jgi:hypothetical protein
MAFANGRHEPNPFKKSDLTRAIRAAFSAGATLQRVEIEPGGKIVLIISGENDLGPPEAAAPLWTANTAS